MHSNVLFNETFQKLIQKSIFSDFTSVFEDFLRL